MPSHTQIAKWGNSHAVRIPSEIVREAGLKPGDSFSPDLGKLGEIILRPDQPKYSIEELVSGITARNKHTEVIWGAPQGNEHW